MGGPKCVSCLPPFVTTQPLGADDTGAMTRSACITSRADPGGAGVELDDGPGQGSRKSRSSSTKKRGRECLLGVGRAGRRAAAREKSCTSSYDPSEAETVTLRLGTAPDARRMGIGRGRPRSTALVTRAAWGTHASLRCWRCRSACHLLCYLPSCPRNLVPQQASQQASQDPGATTRGGWGGGGRRHRTAKASSQGLLARRDSPAAHARPKERWLEGRSSDVWDTAPAQLAQLERPQPRT